MIKERRPNEKCIRIKDDVQKETRDVVEQMLELVKNIEGNPFEYTIKAWGY